MHCATFPTVQTCCTRAVNFSVLFPGIYCFILVCSLSISRCRSPLSSHVSVNPLNAELNPICHLLALLEAHHILHISRIGVNRPWLLFVHKPAAHSFLFYFFLFMSHELLSCVPGWLMACALGKAHYSTGVCVCVCE